MKSIAVVAAACLAIAGCANIHSYDKEGADIEKKDADMMACKSEMAPYSSKDEAAEVFDKCMAGKGYEKRIKKYGL